MTAAPSIGQHLRQPAVALLSVAIGLAAWQLVSMSGLVPRNALPAPAETFTAAVQMIAAGTIWAPTLDTLAGAAAGLLLAAVLAIPLGLALGSLTVLYRVMSAMLEFLRPIPPPAILPIVILLLGTGFQMKLVLVAFGCFFPILLQCIYAARDADPLQRQTARAFRITPLRGFFQIAIPAALPNVFTGVRVSASIALLVAVSVELIAGSPGLGSAIQRSADGGQTAQMTVFVIISGILGVLIAGGLAAVQHRTITWVGRGRAEGSS